MFFQKTKYFTMLLLCFVEFRAFSSDCLGWMEIETEMRNAGLGETVADAMRREERIKAEEEETKKIKDEKLLAKASLLIDRDWKSAIKLLEQSSKSSERNQVQLGILYKTYAGKINSSSERDDYKKAYDCFMHFPRNIEGAERLASLLLQGLHNGSPERERAKGIYSYIILELEKRISQVRDRRVFEIKLKKVCWILGGVCREDGEIDQAIFYFEKFPLFTPSADSLFSLYMKKGERQKAYACKTSRIHELQSYLTKAEDVSLPQEDRVALEKEFKKKIERYFSEGSFGFGALTGLFELAGKGCEKSWVSEEFYNKVEKVFYENKNNFEPINWALAVHYSLMKKSRFPRIREALVYQNELSKREKLLLIDEYRGIVDGAYLAFSSAVFLGYNPSDRLEFIGMYEVRASEVERFRKLYEALPEEAVTSEGFEGGADSKEVLPGRVPKKLEEVLPEKAPAVAPEELEKVFSEGVTKPKKTSKSSLRERKKQESIQRALRRTAAAAAEKTSHGSAAANESLDIRYSFFNKYIEVEFNGLMADEENKKLQRILEDISSCYWDTSGEGKPEILKGLFRGHKGCISRRLDHENRFVYVVAGKGEILVLNVLGHYDD